MGGHVFELPEESNDRTQYTKTIDKLKEHVKTTYKETYVEIAGLFSDPMTQPTVARPAPLKEDTTEDDKMIRNERLKIYAKKMEALEQNLIAVHTIIWGQTSPAMQTKIKSTKEYETKFENHDCLWLLRQIKAITMSYENKKNPMMSELEAKEKFFMCKQELNESPEDYMNKLKAWAEVVEHCGGEIAGSWTNVPEEVGTQEEREKAAVDYTLATAYIKGMDKTRYGVLSAELKNSYAKGQNDYPVDLATAFALMNSYETPKNEQVQNKTNYQHQRHEQSNPHSVTKTEEGHIFVQNMVKKDLIAGTDGRLFEKTKCYNCQAYGHYAGNCHEPNNKGTTLVCNGVLMTQTDKQNSSYINNEWILLDTQSTVSVFNNIQYLTNIRKSKETLRAITNGGYQDSDMIGEFPNLGTVWYNRHSIANILSMHEVRRVCRVTMDTSIEPTLCVHRLDGSIMKFEEQESGLYVFKPKINTSVNIYPACTLVTTVEENKKMFTRRQVFNADLARDLYRKIGRPGVEAFEDILRTNKIHNCPITVDDARRAITIYGPDIPKLKGTTTNGPPVEHVPDHRMIEVPRPILMHHTSVTITIDFIHVNKIPFLTTISRNIGWRTIAPVPNRQKGNILKEINRIIAIYKNRGLSVTSIHGDNEFACIRDSIGPIYLDIAAPHTHVPEIERSNRTIKERARTIIHGLPYKRLPTLFIQHLMMHVVHYLNIFPWKYGVSQELSPESIVIGSPPPDYNKIRIEFGSYAQVYDAPSPSNTPRSRSHGAIALGSTGNAGGAYYFLSLASGEVISRHQWTICPIQDEVIERLDFLAVKDKQPLIQSTGLVVEWGQTQTGTSQTENNEDENDQMEENEDRQEGDDLIIMTSGYDFRDNEVIESVHVRNNHDNENEESLDNTHYENQGAGEEQESNYNTISEYDTNEVHEHSDSTDETVGANINEDDDSNHEIINEEDQTRTITDETREETSNLNERNQGATYNLRNRQTLRPPRRLVEVMDNSNNTKSYETPTTLLQSVLNRVTGNQSDEFKDEMSQANIKKLIFERTLAQMTAKAGIKMYGEKAEQALMQEFAQLEELGVFSAKNAGDLTREQKGNALRAINLITKKRDGRIKGRTVADGSVQRDMYEKSQTASPTVSTDALLVSLIIDAHEQRDVAVADVVAAYLKADMIDYTLLKFTGESVDIMCRMNSKYKECVTVESGKKTLYVQLLKALYGCVVSALLWYELFSGHLKEMGFEINPYDSCIANKQINGKQCTIAWYVDDMKISHVDKEVVSQIIQDLEKKFGKMSVTRGCKHKLLGMNLNFKSNRTVTIQMKDYLRESIDESGLNITHEAATPAKGNLFDVEINSTPLEGEEFEAFQSVVAKLLYVAIRARLDMLLPVAFLCTRVTKSTKQDQQKLKRVLEYVKGSIDLEYTLGAESLNRVQSWVDASYAVHPDMKSQTGGVTSFGIGGFMGKSTKQKLNTKSSTEAELVGASDYLPNTIWLKLFMESQGYRMNETVFEQDNESAIRMEENGRMSAGQKSRHINIRYFWIKDQTKELGIDIRHCPTLSMLADFFTKPLNGGLFRKFRDVILGYKPVSSLRESTCFDVEERVGSIDQRPQNGHIDSIKDTKENISVTTNVPIVLSREQYKNNHQQQGRSLNQTNPVDDNNN